VRRLVGCAFATVTDVDVVDLLRREPHDFHPAAKGEPWAVQDSTLRFLAGSVRPGSTTLETGVGESTVVFLSLSSRHIAVAPDTRERDAITEFCHKHQVPTTALEFLAGTSDRLLPNLAIPPLDVVLIDGQHAFPAPFLDWYYTADAVVQHGLVVIDDVPIRTGEVLRDFLEAEPEWERVADLGRAVAFRKTVSGPVTGKWWLEQPWCHPQGGGPSFWEVLRHKIRVRSRARALVRGRSGRSAGQGSR
jgi:predicted O-methyltransferase YrrM